MCLPTVPAGSTIDINDSTYLMVSIAFAPSLYRVLIGPKGGYTGRQFDDGVLGFDHPPRWWLMRVDDG